jgi:NarL family two-component system response regulator LiaR
MALTAEGAQAIRVLVVDDHDLYRAGLSSLLGSAEEIEIVAQASGGRMGVRLALELKPDVVLMDMRMPDTDGPTATEQILAADPEIRVVALTVASTDSDVGRALVAGACGYLLKESPVEDVVTAIKAAYGGASWLSPRAAEAVLDMVRRDARQDATPARDVTEQLSPRELEVLALVARGLDNGDIAQELDISPRTAKNHVSNILTKLGVPNRIQAAVYAVRTGLA